jgi:hypothetical protein
LALTSPTSGGLSVGIVRLRTKVALFVFVLFVELRRGTSFGMPWRSWSLCDTAGEPGTGLELRGVVIATTVLRMLKLLFLKVSRTRFMLVFLLGLFSEP